MNSIWAFGARPPVAVNSRHACAKPCRKTELAGAEYQPFPVRFMPVIVLI
eukprot:gene22910-27218_t